MRTEHTNLIAGIVGHPEGEPSVDDLDLTNPSLGIPEIHEFFEVFEQSGIVTATEHGYQPTDTARNRFDKNGLFPEDAWKGQYERVKKD